MDSYPRLLFAVAGPSSASYSDPLAFTHRFVSGIQDAVHNVPVFVRLTRFDPVAYAFHEMPHFRLVPIRERLLRQRTRPAETQVSLLNDVTGRFRSERLYRSASLHIGEDRSFRSMDFISQ